jgi:predicted Fe-Mo cluster-binding NifX family protein
MLYNIALTSSDGKQVDLHFGHAVFFHIIQVDERTGLWKAVEQRDLPETTCGDTGFDCGARGGCSGHNDERLNRVIGVLSDCRYLLTSRIGKKPHAVLQRAGITALESPPDIGEAVSRLNKYHLKYGNINKEH